MNGSISRGKKVAKASWVRKLAEKNSETILVIYSKICRNEKILCCEMKWKIEVINVVYSNISLLCERDGNNIVYTSQNNLGLFFSREEKIRCISYFNFGVLHIQIDFLRSISVHIYTNNLQIFYILSYKPTSLFFSLLCQGIQAWYW